MNTKELTLIIIAIIVAGGIIGGCVYTGLTVNNTHNNDTTNTTNITNNTTNVTNQSNEDNQQTEQSSSSSSNYNNNQKTEQASSSSSDNSHMVNYRGEWIDTSKPGQFEGSSQAEVDEYMRAEDAGFP